MRTRDMMARARREIKAAGHTLSPVGRDEESPGKELTCRCLRCGYDVSTRTLKCYLRQYWPEWPTAMQCKGASA